MMSNSNFRSDSSGQTIVLAGFVVAVIIIGMGSILNSVAISGQHKSYEQSEDTFDYFDNIRKEYGVAMMVSSDHGESNPFNLSYSILPEYEAKMKTIVETHGYFVNFSWVNGSYSNNTKRASVTIIFSDGNKFFKDTVAYNLITGKIVYDTIPPGKITDLEVVTPFDGCFEEVDGGLRLTWTAVGDDGYEEGTSASKYDIRYNNSQIYDLVDFFNSPPIPHPYNERPSPNGSTEEYLITDLDIGNPWYFAIIAIDDAGNPSNLSEPHYINTTASSWRPELSNISVNNESTTNVNNPFYSTFKGDNITISFDVNDRENDNVTVKIMVRNRTLNPDYSWNEGAWFPGESWINLVPNDYKNNNYSYNISNINMSWDYYFNVSDNSSCGNIRSIPLNVPDNYYSIEIPIGNRRLLNSSDDVMDAYIDINYPNINYGNNQTINVEKTISPQKHGLIWFDLSSIPPGSTIEYAELSLFVNDSDNNIEINLYVINSPWDEYTVNWTNQPSNILTPSIPNEPIIIDGVIINLNVTSDVQYYLINNSVSWQIRTMNNNEMANFDSKEAIIASRRPSLYVIYE